MMDEMMSGGRGDRGQTEAAEGDGQRRTEVESATGEAGKDSVGGINVGITGTSTVLASG